MWMPSKLCWSINTSDVFVTDNNGRTALIDATINGCQRAAEQLIRNGANVMIEDNDGWQALHHAAHHGHSALVKLLLENHAPVDGNAAHGRTSLMVQGSCLDPEIAAFFAQHNASVNNNEKNE